MRDPKALIRLTAVTAGLVALLDQAAKFAVREHLSLCYRPPVSQCDRVALVGPLGLLRTDNADSAFGLIEGSWLALLLVLAVGLVGWQVATVRARDPRLSRLLAVSIGLQVGGVLGNLTDRLLFGTVTDFIDLRVGGADKGLVLNPADLALGAGALILMALTWAATSRSHLSPAARGRPVAVPTK